MCAPRSAISRWCATARTTPARAVRETNTMAEAAAILPIVPDAAGAVSRPLIEGDKTFSSVTRDVFAPMEARPTALWFVALAASIALLSLGALAIGYQVSTGVGTWGLNRTVGW